MRLEEAPDAVGGADGPAMRLRSLAVDEVRRAPGVVLAAIGGRRRAAAAGPRPPGAGSGDEPGRHHAVGAAVEQEHRYGPGRLAGTDVESARDRCDRRDPLG